MGANRFVTAVAGKRVVKQWFEDVVEEIIVVAVFPFCKFAEEIVRTAAPVLALGDAQPSFLLHKVKEHDLAEKFLSKVDGLYVFLVKVLPNGAVFLDQPF